ncbi:MAG: hypothetical protein ACTIM4_06840 [Marinomonas sp.]
MSLAHIIASIKEWLSFALSTEGILLILLQSLFSQHMVSCKQWPGIPSDFSMASIMSWLRAIRSKISDLSTAKSASTPDMTPTVKAESAIDLS